MQNKIMDDVKPKTIDYLGAEPHEAWVRWQVEKEELRKLLEEPPIKTQTEVKKTIPHELEKILKETNLQTTNAIFPKDISSTPFEIFSSDTIPSIGSKENIETLKRKTDSLDKTPEEKKSINSFFDELANITKDNEHIYGSKNQYKKS